MIEFVIPVKRSSEFRLHPLGFFYLEDHLPGGKSHRVHIWLPNEIETAENDRHQHSFSINSMVIVGGLRSELFHFRESSEGNQREFVVSYSSGHSILSPTGRVGTLDRFSIFETGAGASYFLEAGIIHRINTIKRPCVTLLKTQDRGTKILSYGRQLNELPFERRAVNEFEARRIEELLASLV